ncbi:MAG: (4Fe-4S)-binding protein [Armatimonadetes bacterium]|nr:(4Fe-4S)-binding protein [Armatimonadota bacterium]
MDGHKEYTRDGVTVVWKPELCRHSGLCARGLPDVFDPKRRPWIDMDMADVRQIVEQVTRCPSGALSIRAEDEDGLCVRRQL